MPKAGGFDKAMVRIFNRKKDQEKRRFLRKNMTKSEILLWKELKNRQMQGERFLRQYGVDQYVLDFYSPRLKLAIEIDGDTHFVNNAEEYDKERQRHIETYGIKFLRFTNTDITENLDGALQTIYDQIEESSIDRREIKSHIKKEK